MTVHESINRDAINSKEGTLMFLVNMLVSEEPHNMREDISLKKPSTSNCVGPSILELSIKVPCIPYTCLPVVKS